jgi:hypothetical protein
MSDPTEMNNIRAVGLQWQSEMATTFPLQATNNPPRLEESWISLKGYISYYLQRGWRFS